MFLAFFSVFVMLRTAGASSSDHRRLKGEPFPYSVSNIRASSFEAASSVISYFTSFVQAKPASTIQLQANLASGYVVVANYVDSGCQALSYADYYPLNNCYLESGQYKMWTATATDYVSSIYSDAKCQNLVSTLPTVPYTDACADSGKKYVSTTKTIPSITPVVFQT